MGIAQVTPTQLRENLDLKNTLNPGDAPPRLLLESNALSGDSLHSMVQEDKERS